MIVPSIHNAWRLQSLTSFQFARRSLATAVSSVPATTSILPLGEKKPGALRPHLNVPVNPNHGLYAFFRKIVKDGETTYETVEQVETLKSGRSWNAAELRRKSFKDVHTLWYVLLRERNLLATQKDEARRLGIEATNTLTTKSLRCRKSMARIKYVINERRLLYERAVQRYQQEKDRALAIEAEAEANRVKEERAQAEAQAEAELKAARRAAAAEFQPAAKLANAGLFESTPSQPGGQAKD